ncbi:hypothetical protein C8F04DRAFT_464708 [Mycena alexandri]|uniref:Myb/SANT-like domain-containing protein n=1 Tax=Mycena alexandri TaxID=1745969 RepID=A0AAD6SZ73_9AGAR|nr:hypothetical protein C8F04DRAFT_1094277 [Mycena alexandri]KAJ7036757.1 hypothetical protein C8F04DRAFT_464708 [Mycena alexandri]
MPATTAADWVSNPDDVTNVLKFLHERRSRMGDGGNFDKTVYNEAAVYMASLGPPKKGGAKTAKAIETKWRGLRKLHEYILQVKQKSYPGTSGWTYTDEGGFNVTDDDREAWDNFVKAHPHFKPFATSGWVHFKTVDEMVPSRARGRYIFNAGSVLHADHGIGPSEQSQDDDDAGQTQGSDVSQAISNWSQTDFGDNSQNDFRDDSQPPASDDGARGSQVNTVSSQVAVRRFPATPVAAMKRPSFDDVESPWSSKRSRTTGPESIMALGRSVEGIGKVIESVFAPKTSSAMSPTKKVTTARQMALEDFRAGFLLSDERTRLNILFGRDVSAADAYIADEDPLLRAETGRELLNQLNPTPMF